MNYELMWFSGAMQLMEKKNARKQTLEQLHERRKHVTAVRGAPGRKAGAIACATVKSAMSKRKNDHAIGKKRAEKPCCVDR